MSLYPGYPRQVDGQWLLDDEALQDSMARAMEDAMADVLDKVKGTSLPEAGREDLRLLFVAIARGILGYLQDHEGEILAGVTITHPSGPSVSHTVDDVDLNIEMDR